MEILRSINWLDILVLLLLIRGTYLGIKNGLTAELFRFIGTVISLALAVQWYSQVAEILILNMSLPAWLSHFLCFIVIVQLIRAVFKYGLVLLLKVMNIQFVPQLEKIGGGVVGMGRGILVSGILVLVINFFPIDYVKESIYDKSFTGVFLMKVMQRTYKSVTFWIPESKAKKAIFSMPSTTVKAKRSRRRK